MTFTATATRAAAHTLVALEGRLCALTAAQLTETVTDQLATGARHLVLDLDRVTLADAAALRALVTGHQAARRAGGTLRLGCASPRNQRLLHISGVAKILTATTPLAATAACS